MALQPPSRLSAQCWARSAPVSVQAPVAQADAWPQRASGPQVPQRGSGPLRGPSTTRCTPPSPLGKQREIHPEQLQFTGALDTHRSGLDTHRGALDTHRGAPNTHRQAAPPDSHRQMNLVPTPQPPLGSAVVAMPTVGSAVGSAVIPIVAVARQGRSISPRGSRTPGYQLAHSGSARVIDAVQAAYAFNANQMGIARQRSQSPSRQLTARSQSPASRGMPEVETMSSIEEGERVKKWVAALIDRDVSKSCEVPASIGFPQYTIARGASIPSEFRPNNVCSATEALPMACDVIRTDMEKELVRMREDGSKVVKQLTQDGLSAISELVQAFEGLKKGMDRGIANFKATVDREKETLHNEVAATLQELSQTELERHRLECVASWSTGVENVQREVSELHESLCGNLLAHEKREGVGSRVSALHALVAQEKQEGPSRMLTGETVTLEPKPSQEEVRLRDIDADISSVLLSTFESRVQLQISALEDRIRSAEGLGAQVTELQEQMEGTTAGPLRTFLEQERLAGQSRKEMMDTMVRVVNTARQDLDREVRTLKQRGLEEALATASPCTSDFINAIDQLRAIMQKEVEARQAEIKRLETEEIKRLDSAIDSLMREVASAQRLIMRK